MIKSNTLLNTLFDKNNRYLTSEASNILITIFIKLLFSLIFTILIIGSLIFFIDNYLILKVQFSFIDYASLIIGNVCFYYCFTMIKEQVIPYIASNPIMIIGIIYSSFFNASLINNIIHLLFPTIVSISTIYLFLSIIIYYLILNYYYQKKLGHK